MTSYEIITSDLKKSGTAAKQCDDTSPFGNPGK